MMKTLVSAVLLACAGIAATAHAEVLNLHYTAGDYSRDTCFRSPAGGLTRNPSTPLDQWCHLEIPIELPAGKTIRQISVFYGIDGPGDGYVVADLSYGDLQAVPNNGSGFGNTLFDWSSSLEMPISVSGVGEGHLMRQFVLGRSPSLVTYPDAFVIPAKRMYTVRIDTVANGEFLGLRVLYL